MCALPSPKIMICRDCGYEFTVQPHRTDEKPFLCCERCGSQNIDISDVTEFVRYKPLRIIKDLLHFKIF